MKSVVKRCALIVASIFVLSSSLSAGEWKLGDIKSQECLHNSTVISSTTKYCHNCGNQQGNLTSWTFETTCDDVLQTRLVQSKIGCNTSEGRGSETAQKTAHISAATSKLPGSTTRCR